MPTTGMTVEQLIGLPALLGLMQETTTGLPDPVPDSFDKNEYKVIGNSSRQFIGYGQRKTAKAVKFGAPAVGAGLENLGFKDFILLSFKEVLPMDPNTYLRLHDFDNYNMQKMGATEVARQVGLFKEKFDNARKVQKWSNLRYGITYLSSAGDLLPTSSGAGADMTLDFGVEAGHKTQLDFDGNGDIIANLWSDTTNANIPQQIENLQVAAAKETGLPIEHAFYGSIVPGYLRKNSFMQVFLQYDPGMYKVFNRSTTIPAGILGLEWHPMQKAFFENSSGNQSMWDVDKVTFTPDPAKGNWWKKILGSEMVPNSIDLAGQTAATVTANAQLVHGQWARSQYNFDGSCSMLNYFGDNFLYAILNHKAIYIATID